MKPNIISISPFRCRMWALHDRLESTISEYTCRLEIESFGKHGQMIPVLGRHIRDDPDFSVELIYGARRLFVARHLGVDLLVDLREINDRAAIVSMDAENRLRSDISPYERGMSYARWLRGGHFASQEDMARTLKTSAAQVSRLLKLARLPSVVVDAFGNPQEIREAWGLAIMEALDDPHRRDSILKAARRYVAQNSRPAAAEMFSTFVSALPSPGRRRCETRDHVVCNDAGVPIFRIRRLRTAIALLVPSDRLPPPMLSTITQQLLALLGHPSLGGQNCRKRSASKLSRDRTKVTLMERAAP